jgi:hypothetical protein
MDEVDAVRSRCKVSGLELPPFRLDCDRNPESVIADPARWCGGLSPPELLFELPALLVLLLLLLMLLLWWLAAARCFSRSARNLLSFRKCYSYSFGLQ